MIVNSYKFTVRTVYNSLRVQFQAFLRSYSNLHENLERGQSNDVILCGDFNIDLLQILSSPFLHLMSSLYLIPMISYPIMISNSVTLIDNVFMILPDDCTSCVLSYDLSDHLPVLIIKKCFCISRCIKYSKYCIL